MSWKRVQTAHLCCVCRCCFRDRCVIECQPRSTWCQQGLEPLGATSRRKLPSPRGKRRRNWLRPPKGEEGSRRRRGFRGRHVAAGRTSRPTREPWLAGLWTLETHASPSQSGDVTF